MEKNLQQKNQLIMTTGCSTKSITANFEINTYELTLQSTGNGEIGKTPDKTIYEHGDKITVTATPQIGWHYLGWYEDGELFTTELSTELTLESTRTLTAFFEINTYELTLEVTGEGTVTKDPTKTIFEHGDECTLTAIPDYGWHFAEWETNDSSTSENPLKITMDATKNYRAVFERNEYTLTLEVTGEGSATKFPDKEKFLYEDVATITAQASEGWTFLYWEGDVDSKYSTQTTIEINEDEVATAVFGQPRYEFSGPATVVAGQEFKVYVTAKDLGDFKALSSSIHYDKEYIKETYTKSINEISEWGGMQYGYYDDMIGLSYEGTSTSIKDSNIFEITFMPLKATESSEIIFKNDSTYPQYYKNEITNPDDRKTVVDYSDRHSVEIKSYTLSMNKNDEGGGEISPSASFTRYFEPTQVTLNATPTKNATEEYAFIQWELSTGATTSNREWQINVDRDIVATATFLEYKYLLTLEKETGQSTWGSVGKSAYTPNGKYYLGQEVTITATPETGYDFDFWSGDVPQEGSNTNPEAIRDGGIGNQNNPLVIVMNDNKNIKVNYKKEREILLWIRQVKVMFLHLQIHQLILMFMIMAMLLHYCYTFEWMAI